MNVWTPIAVASVTALVIAVGCEPAAAPRGGGACRDQPNMLAALGSLRNARASLERAEHDKGGWRVAALEATGNAIRETENGCAFADR